VFWLHASSAARLEQSIRNTLEELKEPGVGDPRLSVFQLFRAWLLDRKQERTWMIILDNADDERFLLQPPGAAGLQETDGQCQQAGDSERCLDYLPFCEHGTLLATSRSRTAASQIVTPDDIIVVGPMDQAHGIALLQQKLDNSSGSLEYTLEDLSQLAMELDSMPLAMAQAAAYIRERTPRCSVKEYLDKLTGEQTRLDVLGQHTRDLRRDRDAQNCILKTWHITFEHIRQRESSAADLLSLMSFFDRNAIPESLLHMRDLDQTAASEPNPPAHFGVRLSLRRFISRHPIPKLQSRKRSNQQQSDPSLKREAHSRVNDRLGTSTNGPPNEQTPNFADDIQMLRNYSLVTVIAGSPSFEMHRLVQLATQDWLKANGSFERCGGQFMMNLDEAFPLGGLKDWAICQPLFPHVFAAMELKLQDRNSVLRQASMLTKGTRHANNMGAYIAGQQMIEQAFKDRLELLGPGHEDTINAMLDLGIAYSHMRQYEKAESVQVEAMNRAARLLGENHEITMNATLILASTYSESGKLVEAETMQLKVLRWIRKKYGEKYDETILVMCDLATTLSKRGRHSEAEDLAERAVGIARKLHPECSLIALNPLKCQATVYFEAGHYEEAGRLLDEVFLRSSKLLGDDHPQTLHIMHWLSCTTYALGRRRSAVDLLRECAEKSERKLGPHHLDTVQLYEQVRQWEANDGLHEIAGDGEPIEPDHGNGVR
jgi:tetratricopeptide (TPR) repeat protein